MSALSRPVLVLNRSWIAINVVSVARALLLLWNETAQAVDPRTYQTYNWSDWADLCPDDDELAVSTVSLRLCVPEVITLTQYDRLPTGEVTLSRRNIHKRDRFSCQYCGAMPSGEDLTIDHVLPRSRGGETTWTNCVLACLECNKKKDNRTPAEAGMKLKKMPKKPMWSPLYSLTSLPIESWKKFISEVYWQVELEC